MKTLSEHIRLLLEKLLPSAKKISKVVIERSVIEDIIEFAKEIYPKEFVAVLQGRISQDNVIVNGLLYQPFESASGTAVMRVNLPMISGSVGSVHSHPSRSNRPSNADLQFFAKRGIVNLIICSPYRIEDIACYDFEGNIREFIIA